MNHVDYGLMRGHGTYEMGYGGLSGCLACMQTICEFNDQTVSKISFFSENMHLH
jgi:hypothetical protein